MNVNFALFFLSKNQNFMYKTLNFFSNNKYLKQCCYSLISQRFQTNKNGSNSEIQKNYTTQPEKNDDEEKKPNKKLPPLMDFPILVWPSFGKTLKNFFLTNFIIKPYMDNDFSLAEFVLGSKKAVDVVSNKLSAGELKSLEGLVMGDIIPTLQARLSIMSLSQREQLSVNEEDIYFSFPYQVGIIFNEEQDDQQKRFVEITMVHHSLKGLSGMRSRGEEIPINVGLLPEHRDKICIANYRYIKEFTKGVESDWTINLVNHFKPADHLEE